LPAERFPAHPRRHPGDGENGDAVSVRRLPDAALAFRPRRSDAQPAAGEEDAARAAAAVAAAVAERRRSDSEPIPRRDFHRGDDADVFQSVRPRLAEPRTAAAEDAAVAADVAAADRLRRRVQNDSAGHRVRARAAVVAADARPDEEASLHRAGRPSCRQPSRSAARTPGACAACTCESAHPAAPASHRNRSTGSASTPRDRSSCRLNKGCFSAGASSGGALYTSARGAQGRHGAPQNVADVDRARAGFESRRLLGRSPCRGSAAVAIDTG